jgi:hypothetical protein
MATPAPSLDVIVSVEHDSVRGDHGARPGRRSAHEGEPAFDGAQSCAAHVQRT